MKALKRSILCIMGAYMLAYAGTAVLSNLDFEKNRDKICDEAPNLLVARKYNVNVNGEKKGLMLVGENHAYTKSEMNYARNLIKDYDAICVEGSVKKPQESLCRTMVRNLSSYPNYFELKGSGRLYMNSDEISASRKRITLEDMNPFDTLDSGQKLALLGKKTLDFLIAPFKYFKGRNERNISKEDYAKSIKDSGLNSYIFNSRKRENTIANKIASVLSRKDSKNIICFVGANHLNPIEGRLRQKLNFSD